MWKVVVAGSVLVLSTGLATVFARGSTTVQETFRFAAFGLSSEAIGTVPDAHMGELKVELQRMQAQVAL
jgi:hypothetical protein